jgi:hypothetical protein
MLVNGPVKVGPQAGDLDIGLVDEPPLPRPVSTRPGRLGQPGREARHPPKHRNVINVEAAFSEQLLDIP